MTLRKLRRKIDRNRKNALRRFEKQRRANSLAQPGKHEYRIVLDHLKPAFNIGKIFRSADAFGAAAVHLVGIDFFDPLPALGSFKYVPASFHDTFQACWEDLRRRGYTVFALAHDGEKGLPTVSLPPKSAFVFGHEENGFSFDLSDYTDLQSIRIPQFGRVSCLNVSVAASLVMYEYLKQHDRGYGLR